MSKPRHRRLPDLSRAEISRLNGIKGGEAIRKRAEELFQQKLNEASSDEEIMAIKKKRAKRLMYAALNRGEIIRATSCEKCGKLPKKRGLDGHHHKGYDNEFAADVIWLCGTCHQFAHPPRFSRPRTDDEKSRMSMSGKKAYEEGRHVPMRRYGQDNPFYGKRHSEETRQKMRDAR